MPKMYLVTGGAGSSGSHLVQALIEVQSLAGWWLTRDLNPDLEQAVSAARHDNAEVGQAILERT